MEAVGAPARDLARAHASGQASVVASIDAVLDAIEAVQPTVNAFAWVREAARADAMEAERRIADGQARPLEGVPFTVKDLCAIADGPTNHGSRAFEGHRYGEDAYAVAKLRAAGAILVATTTSSEFGNRPTTESALFGATRNPWDPSRTSGGSSGGAGVSAALGIASLNQGSDGGGSVRIPSSCCGVYGLKTSRGRISLGPFMAEEWAGLDVYGPITRTVADAATFLDVTAGPGPGEPFWAPPPPAPFIDACGAEPRLKIAVAYERDGEQVDPACIEATRDTASLLSSLGHTVVEAAPDLLPLEFGFLVITTVCIGNKPLTDQQLELLEPRTRVIFTAASGVPAVEYVRAVDDMHRACRRALTFWNDYDLLLTPTLSKPAPPLGTIAADDAKVWDDYRNWLCWTWPFNVTGQPAASVPAGFTADGVPVGVQLVGRPADDWTVLAVSAQLERARPWLDTKPATWPS